MSLLPRFLKLIKPLTYFISILFVSTLLGACGGGGGGGGSSSSSSSSGGTPTTYNITGSVTGNGVIASVTITLSGDSADVTTTDGSGNYSFTSLANGNYTVTPTLANHTFSPASTPVTISGGNVSAASLTSLGNLSGTLTGVGAAGATITLTGATSPTPATTDGSGNYSFSGLNTGSHTITPSIAGSAFAPVSTVVNYTGAESTGNDFVGSAAGTVWTISGAVSGDIGPNVTLTLSGDTSGSTTSDSVGDYSFAGLADGGNFTVTASRTDYNFTAPVTINPLNADALNTDFTATNTKPQATGYNVTGTVTYSGTETGDIYIRLDESGGGSTDYGTTITTSGAYTIRGVPDGSYVAVAYMDHLDIGAENAANPTGASGITVVSGGAVANLTLTDAATPTVAPSAGVIGFPAEQSVLVVWDNPEDSSYKEIADSYDVYWDTSSSPGPGSNIGSALAVPANGGESLYLVTGLTNGQILYFGVRAKVGGSNSSVVVSLAVTVGPVTGGSSISGSATHPAATGPMLVGVYDVNDSAGPPSIYITQVASPASPQSYTITGVPDGAYYLFAVVDMNNDGMIGLGDIQTPENNTGVIFISGSNVSQNITLTSDSASLDLSTTHSDDATPSHIYSINFRPQDNMRRVIAMAITAGPGIEVPIDIAKNSWGDFSSWFGNIPLPKVGDQYGVGVTYSDANIETLAATVGTVLDSFATSMTVSSSTTPTYSWVAPASPPSPYFYTVRISETVNWSEVWEYNVISPTATSVVHNEDGTADVPVLASTTTYQFRLLVVDLNGNTAEYSMDFTTP